MTRDELVQIVINAAREENGKKRIECATALGLAKKHSVKAAEIGAVCNDNQIKIVNCQLGCFGE
jgi:hypothetical protein